MLLLCHQLTPRCSTVTVSLFTTFLSRQGKSCVFCVVPSLNLTEVSKRQPCEQGTEENKRCNDLRRETKIVRKIDSYILVRGKGKKKLYVFVTFFSSSGTSVLWQRYQWICFWIRWFWYSTLSDSLLAAYLPQTTESLYLKLGYQQLWHVSVSSVCSSFYGSAF